MPSPATRHRLIHRQKGWPELGRTEVAASLGLSPAAARLLRHIPYFEDSETMQILPSAQPHSYTESQRIAPYAERGKRSGAGDDNDNDDYMRIFSPGTGRKLRAFVVGPYVFCCL
ncbi:hypothetical protein PG994_003918 [Apiospora phragmitis]|uniref:Uncharacterized protein n=1 Tax=Apiospora phragmitis TaxID=2905665 RepID=A0ABR1VZG7_9PEZI